jgi:hypothetical protein
MNTSERKSKGKAPLAEWRLAVKKSNRSDFAGQQIYTLPDFRFSRGATFRAGHYTKAWKMAISVQVLTNHYTY